MLERAHHLGLRTGESDLAHGDAEQFAVLRHADGFARCTDQLNAIFLEHTAVGQIERAVERSLAAHRRQQRVGLFLGDDLLDHARIDRLDIDRIRRFRVGHDRRRVRVDQDHPIALGFQRLAGLGPGVIELASLADDDRPSPDDEDGAEISSFWHQVCLRAERFR